MTKDRSTWDAALVEGLVGQATDPDLATLERGDPGDEGIDVLLGDDGEADRHQLRVRHGLALASPLGGVRAPVDELARLELLGLGEVVAHHRADVDHDRAGHDLALVVAVLVEELVEQQARQRPLGQAAAHRDRALHGGRHRGSPFFDPRRATSNRSASRGADGNSRRARS
ncbi:MAG: hypothetical protein ABSA14_13970 [Acidimicrobiales bacterium]